MASYDPQAWDRFVQLLRLKLGVDLGYDDLRVAIEEIFNFKLDHRSVSHAELETIEQLFEIVARYSPFPEDRAAYPTIYKDEQEICAAVDRARQKLGLC